MIEQDELASSRAGQAPDSGQEQGDYLPSPGTLLRQGREAAGVHRASLAAALKVSVHKIEALEQDQFDQLPDAVFTRALAASVCRMLKLDPAPILDRLPATHHVRPPPQNRGINESFRARNVGSSTSAWSSISRPAVLAGVVLLLGALILVFLPTLRQHAVFSSSSPAGVSSADGSVAAVPPALNGAAEDADTASREAPPAAAAGDSAQPPAAASTAAGVSPAAPLPANPAMAPGAEGSAAAADFGAGLAFSATGPSWIKVVDAKGQVVFNRTLQTGEVADVSGSFPFAVTIGRIDVTQVKVRGQAFDLAAVSKNNVARFEVK